MTQPGATTPPGKRPPRPTGPTPRPAPGNRVHCDGEPGEVGIVVTSDEWLDTFQLRGVPISAQVPVEWPRGGFPVYRWERVSDLVLVSG